MTFLELLFDDADHTCFSATPRGISIRPAVVIYPEEAFFSINSMDSTKTRADCNVVKYRNILIEMDKIPLEQQEKHITEIELPYSTAVFSGSKSVHYIICLAFPLKDEATYRALVRRVYKAVGNDMVDQSCKNPSRFSRLPGHIRKDTGKEQTLLMADYRVPNSVLEEWLIKRGAPVEEAWENLTPEPRSTFKNASRLYPSTKNFLMYGADEGWNLKLFKSAADLYRCGFSEEEITNELLRITGTLDFNDKKTIASAIRNESEKTIRS